MCQPCLPLVSFMHLHVSVTCCGLCFCLLLKIAHLEGDLTDQSILHQRCISCKSHSLLGSHVFKVKLWPSQSPSLMLGKMPGWDDWDTMGPIKFCCLSSFASPYFCNLTRIVCTTFHSKWMMWKVVLQSRFICTSMNGHFWRMLHRCTVCVK